MTTSTGRSDGRALLPFAVFLLFYLGLSLWSGDFYAVPMPTAFIAASAAALIMGKKPLEEKVEIYARSMGESNIMLMVLIFILAGAFAAVAKSSGAVDSAVLIARHLIPDRLLASGIFLVSSACTSEKNASSELSSTSSPVASKDAVSTSTNASPASLPVAEPP